MKTACWIAGFLGCLGGILGACGAGTAESQPGEAAHVAAVTVVPDSEPEEPMVQPPGAAEPVEPTPVEPSSVDPVPAAPIAADLLAAKERFQVGVTAFQEGRFADAKEAFEGAYTLSQKPQVLYNLAMVELQLGNRGAACRHIRLYEASGGIDPEVRARRLAEFQFCFSP